MSGGVSDGGILLQHILSQPLGAILVLFCHHTGPLDDKLRIEVTTTGEGEGYYISGGQKIDIKYTKVDNDTPMKLYNKDGSPLEMNRGKTYVAVMGNSAMDKIELNYNK